MNSLPSISKELDKDVISKINLKNFNSISPFFYKLITEWMSDAYKQFQDIDKFLILIYLISKDFEFFFWKKQYTKKNTETIHRPTKNLEKIQLETQKILKWCEKYI